METNKEEIKQFAVKYTTVSFHQGQPDPKIALDSFFKMILDAMTTGFVLHDPLQVIQLSPGIVFLVQYMKKV